MLLITLLVLLGSPAAAQDISRADTGKWLAKYENAKPDFKPGDVLAAKDLERLRPFVAPGYLEQFNFPEMSMKVIAQRSHRPRRDYVDCTEKHLGQTRLNADGVLANHICGQPFTNDSLEPSDPLSGLKAVWNFEMRWQNYGQFTLQTADVPMRFGGSHDANSFATLEMPPQAWLLGVTLSTPLPTDPSRYLKGGGTIRRTFFDSYQRIYLSHLAQQAATGGVLVSVPNAATYFWKEFTGFTNPYDVRGQVFITHRYNDFHRADDAWAYDPATRRVRRLSAESKSDSFMGTDETLNDFYTFTGHVLDWNWKFLGWKDMLCVLDSQYMYKHEYGPNGDIPDDVWSVRRMAVVERTPKNPANVYSSVLDFWDAENWHPSMALIFDHDRKLWRIMHDQSYWSEDAKEWRELNHGAETSSLLGGEVIDPRHSRATLWVNYGCGNPDVSLERAKQLFDPSTLEQLHR